MAWLSVEFRFLKKWYNKIPAASLVSSRLPAKKLVNAPESAVELAFNPLWFDQCFVPCHVNKTEIICTIQISKQIWPTTIKVTGPRHRGWIVQNSSGILMASSKTRTVIMLQLVSLNNVPTSFWFESFQLNMSNPDCQKNYCVVFHINLPFF